MKSQRSTSTLGFMIRLFLPLLLTTVTNNKGGCYPVVVDCFQYQLLSTIQQQPRQVLPKHQNQQHVNCWGFNRGFQPPSSSSSSYYLLLKSTTSSSSTTDNDNTSKKESEEKEQQRSEAAESQQTPKTDYDNFIQEELEAGDDDDDDQQQKYYSMPWSQNQEWALNDNLSKYTIMVPLKNNKTTGIYALWRTMLKEVPELTGYPIEFLQERCSDNNIENNNDEDNKSTTTTTNTAAVAPGILPYLDDYEFTTKGGISGDVYGILGLADGTRIETSEVTNIELTLIKGFVVTSDGSTAYELGRPKREEFVTTTMMDTDTAAAAMKDTANGVAKGGGELLKNVNNNMPLATPTEDADGMLLRLGATTGILLAGATAMNMLAHHLTVNVFWV